MDGGRHVINRIALASCQDNSVAFQEGFAIIAQDTAECFIIVSEEPLLSFEIKLVD